LPVDARAVLDALIQGGPLLVAVLDEGGAVSLCSRAFEQATGIGAGAPRPAWLAHASQGSQIQIQERQFEVYTQPAGDALLLVLRDRTELIAMEDQLWEQQTRLSKVYSDLSVKNQALTSTFEKLSQRESELQELNRGLEAKVAEGLQQIERSNKLRRYLSPEVANSIVSSDTPDLTTRKRILTVFFANLSSFDELTAEMESEEIIDLLNDYRREMTAIIFAHGGTLDKFNSARVMGFFGDPIPHEDHAARAVRMAIAMRDGARRLRPKWFPSSDAVDLCVGIHTGYATVGNVGSESRVDYTVIGKNVALAGVLQQEAKPGQILISARTYEIVKEWVDAEPQSIVLKEGSRPVTAYNVVSERGAPGAAIIETDKTRLLQREEGEREEMPRRLGPYVVQEKLGQGGMGVVYKALDPQLQRLAAVKVLASELAADTKFVARFQREARVLASLSSPYVAQIYFISELERPPFFAMEFIEGPTLGRVLADQGKLPLRRALELVTQMEQGLAHAAEKGIIHRDIKPDNVMLTLKGQVKLTDFGLVKVASGPGLTSRGIVLGTPLYMSPEQARGEEVDLRSDIYSVGATFYHMLVGKAPFQADKAVTVMRMHEEAPLPPLSTLPPTLSASVYQIIHRMMAKQREDRYQTHAELLEALENC